MPPATVTAALLLHALNCRIVQKLLEHPAWREDLVHAAHRDRVFR